VTYHIEFTSLAARQIRKMPRQSQDRVLALISDLADNPRPRGALKLTGEQTAWRMRVGDYRVIYDIYDDTLTVTVVRAGHRREVYLR
jgi:mRNA interferase RelE/StbE